MISKSFKEKSVVSGQQIGLLSGALYTTYKLLGAAKKAEKDKLKAYFWLETNDTDFEEVNRISYLSKENKLKQLKWKKDSQGMRIGDIKIDQELIDLLSFFFKDNIETKYSKIVKKIVMNAYRIDRTFKEATLILFQSIFASINIEFFIPDKEDFLNFSQSILQKEVSLTKDLEQANAFVLKNKKRLAIFKRNGSFFTRNGQEIILKDQVLLPNVKTRSLLQDSYLNVSFYIAGSSEYSYLEALKSRYLLHNIKPAKVIKRMHATLLSYEDLKKIKEIEIDFEEINNSNYFFELKEKLFKKYSFNVKEEKKKLKLFKENYIQSLKDLNISSKRIEKILYKEQKQLLGFKRKEYITRNKKEFANCQYLFNIIKPFGKLQEREFNLIYYLNLYGLEFILYLYETYQENSKHNIIQLP